MKTTFLPNDKTSQEKSKLLRNFHKMLLDCIFDIIGEDAKSPDIPRTRDIWINVGFI